MNQEEKAFELETRLDRLDARIRKLDNFKVARIFELSEQLDQVLLLLRRIERKLDEDLDE